MRYPGRKSLHLECYHKLGLCTSFVFTNIIETCLTPSTEATCCFHPQEEHIKVIIALLEKYGRDPKVLDVLCSLCVGNGTAVRSSQNNICDYLLPGRNLLLQTQLVDHVSR